MKSSTVWNGAKADVTRNGSGVRAFCQPAAVPKAGSNRDGGAFSRILHQTEGFMDKALRGDAVVHLPRASNNAGHESLRLARRVKSFQSLF